MHRTALLGLDLSILFFACSTIDVAVSFRQPTSSTIYNEQAELCFIIAQHIEQLLSVCRTLARYVLGDLYSSTVDGHLSITLLPCDSISYTTWKVAGEENIVHEEKINTHQTISVSNSSWDPVYATARDVSFSEVGVLVSSTMPCAWLDMFHNGRKSMCLTQPQW